MQNPSPSSVKHYFLQFVEECERMPFLDVAQQIREAFEQFRMQGPDALRKFIDYLPLYFDLPSWLPSGESHTLEARQRHRLRKALEAEARLFYGRPEEWPQGTEASRTRLLGRRDELVRSVEYRRGQVDLASPGSDYHQHLLCSFAQLSEDVAQRLDRLDDMLLEAERPALTAERLHTQQMAEAESTVSATTVPEVFPAAALPQLKAFLVQHRLIDSNTGKAIPGRTKPWMWAAVARGLGPRLLNGYPADYAKWFRGEFGATIGDRTMRGAFQEEGSTIPTHEPLYIAARSFHIKP